MRVKKKMAKRYIVFIALFFTVFTSANAQIWERLGVDSLSNEKEGLSIKVDALTFFRDNEYDNDMLDGYSLPGAWLRPTICYNPQGNIHFEVGASALIFDGANKYPCYAYNDIGTWKGNQYQSGAHILPWIRAHVNVANWSFVLGDIYGAQNHHFITPLYNDEQLISADPEAGLQILYHGNCFEMDASLNWQSYQFKEDTHQEAFTVGFSNRYRFTKELSAILQIQAQHRGGEQDNTNMGVQTLWNAALGLNYNHIVYNKSVNLIGAEAEILGCMQQTGRLWPFDKGGAFHAAVKTIMWRDFDVKVGLFYAPKHFVSLYGNPMFSTITLKGEATYLPTGNRYYANHYDGIRTAYLHIGYSYTWAGAYTLGTNLEIFNYHHGRNLYSDSPSASSTPFSFGLYFRFTPILKL